MKDQYGRTIDYLRISITDACNLRCRYCMPESAAGCALEQAEQNPPLTVEEMLKIVHAAAGLGITHYRITGGEPLVRKECVELVQKIKAVPGTASVGITTNGVRLASCARDLKAAGCDSVNVSLDTVDAAEFAALTGRDALEQVKQGICAAKEAGLLVKLNAVHRKELHAQELIEFAEQEKVPVRFIEVMPVGAGKSYVGPSNEALKTELEQVWGMYAGPGKRRKRSCGLCAVRKAVDARRLYQRDPRKVLRKLQPRTADKPRLFKALSLL